MNSTCTHEASHVACAWLLGRDVDYTWRAVGSVWPGETAGRAQIPIEDRIEVSQLPIALVGYMATDTEGWPPSFENALEEKREALGIVLQHLDATPERYARLVAFTEELLADPDFRRLRDSIARALDRVPRLEGETIEQLAAIIFDTELGGATL